jgi:hypothetical protein
VLLLWGAKPAEPPTGFKVDHAPQVLSTLDNLVTLNMTAQGAGGREPLLYQGPSVAEGSKFKDLPDLADRCLYFADKDGKPLAAKPADAAFADGKAQLFIGYKPGCPVCAGEEAVFELKLGLARNPDLARTVLLGVSCRADVLAVARDQAKKPSDESVAKYAEALRKEKKSFRLVYPDAATAAAAFSSGDVPVFGPAAWDIKLEKEALEAQLSVGQEVRPFKDDPRLDNLVARLDGTALAHRFSRAVFPNPRDGRSLAAGFEIAGLDRRDLLLAYDVPELTFAKMEEKAFRVNLTGLTAVLREAEVIPSDHLAQAGVILDAAENEYARGTYNVSVKEFAFYVTNVSVQMNVAELTVRADGPKLANLSDFNLTAFPLLAKFHAGLPPLQVTLARDSQRSGRLPLKVRFHVLGPVRVAEGPKGALIWQDWPAPVLGSLEVKVKNYSFTDARAQTGATVTLETGYGESVKGGDTFGEGARLAKLTLRAPERTFSLWLGEDRLFEFESRKFDSRVGSVRADRVASPTSKFTFTLSGSETRYYGRLANLRLGLQALKRIVKPSAILLIGTVTGLPTQRYWDADSEHYGGSVFTDDPYGYSEETPSSRLLEGVKAEDYVIPVGRLPFDEETGDPSKLLELAASAYAAPRLDLSPPLAADSSTGLQIFLDSLTSAGATAQRVASDGRITFKPGDVKPAKDFEFKDRALFYLRADDSAFAASHVLAKGARGFIGFAREVNDTVADRFLEVFYQKLAVSTSGETLTQKFLDAKRRLAEEYKGSPALAHLQTVRYYGDPALPAKR